MQGMCNVGGLGAVYMYVCSVHVSVCVGVNTFACVAEYE